MSQLSNKSVPEVGRSAVLLVAAVLLLCTIHVDAADLSSGDHKLTLDTTLSWGARYRLSDPDPAIIGLPAGGEAFSVNADDGNLNFDGLSSNALKVTMDLDYSYSNFGVFLRGSGFYDYELEEGDRERTPLSDAAMDWAGSRAELLDAFAWYRFNLGSGGGQVRLGQQVLNWGESTFIQGGLSSLNPVDVAALRVPGAELREAFRPNGMLWGSFDMTDALSMEAFYQYDWEPTVIDPAGTYFSSSDIAGRGAQYVFLGFGAFADTGEAPFYAQASGRPFMSVARSADRRPDDGGQYGVALRWFADQLGGTEFGFYYTNYHSRLPVVNGVTGTIQGAQAAQVAGQQAGLAVYNYFGVAPGSSPMVDAIAQQAGTAAGTDAFASTASYFFSYPEDITMYGISWNAQLGTTGIAFQGEVSHAQDKPFLVDDVELLFAALSPISAGLAATNQVVPGGAGFATEVPGYRLLDATQLQFTLTKAFGPLLRADQGVLVIEPAVTHISSLPSKDVLRFEVPGTFTSGNPIHAGPGGAHAGKAFEPADAFADATSWGYQLAGRLDYNNAIGALNLAPRFAWAHDVDGNTPGPGGNFQEGRYALTVGVAAGYLNAWEFDLSYTNYGGAGRYNLINDRDFLGGVIKYSY